MTALLCSCGEPLSLVITAGRMPGRALVAAACVSARSCGFRGADWFCDDTPASVQAASESIAEQLRSTSAEEAA